MKSLFNNRGIALVIVMWLLVLLTVLASELVVSAKGDIGSVRNFKEDREAYFLAYSGVQMAINEIMGKYDFNAPGPEGVGFYGMSEGSPVTADFSRTGLKLGDGTVSYLIEDENSRINLNWLADNPEFLIPFLQIAFDGMDADIGTMADSILDWVDMDDLHRANGAESEYYLGLSSPYVPKNGPFDTLSELKRVKGIDEESYRILSRLLTVHSVSGVNVNTASEEALFSLGIASDELEEILKLRDSVGYANPESRSETFTVYSEGRLEGSPTVHRISTVVRRVSDSRLVFLEWNDDFPNSFPEIISKSERD